MDTQPSFLKSLRVLYFALLFGQILFAAIVIILFVTGSITPAINGIQEKVFLYVAITVALLLTGFSHKIFNQKLEEAKRQSNTNDKLNEYRAAFILQLALCEGPALLVIIFYFLTENNLLLVSLFLLLLNFAKLYPVKSKIIQQLELDNNEENLLD